MDATPFDRRSFLRRSAITAGGLAVGSVLSRPGGAWAQTRGVPATVFDRPAVTFGVMAGDVSSDSAVIWARADRTARMLVELSTRGSFRHGRTVVGPLATPDTDLTAQRLVGGLPDGERIAYRVSFTDPFGRRAGEPVEGTFVTPSRRRPDDVTFVFTGDNAGQGWGIDRSRGGMRCWETMRSLQPDFLIHSGDTVYADGPLKPTVTLPDGTTWTNFVTPEKSKVAETLDEFRGQFRYNLFDDNVLRFNADVPIYVQWDDHEVVNNWYPGEVLGDRPEYTETSVDVLSARARQAFHEYFPIGRTVERQGRVYRQISYGPTLDVFMLDMRTFRGPNNADTGTAPPDTSFLGADQVRWLTRNLRRSRATWKVVAADMPLGLVVPDGAAIEAVAQGNPGGPLGRELEIASLLSAIRGVTNVVWVTADVHYCAAHRYDPATAVFTDFDPFWEFVAGPVHAGTFGPNVLDPTFGPRAVFQKPAAYPNMDPSQGYQFFGHVSIHDGGQAMTVALVDVNGVVLFSQELAAA